MEKKDIYNLWILYTTKNDECYFRQFVSGFVKIWQEQIDLNFDDVKLCEQIKPDGPNLSRLPEELLPAIEKFLIIARDHSDQETMDEVKLTETTLLLKCLTIISRHFDNILTIVKSSYISSCIAIANNLFKKLIDKNSVLVEELDFLKTFCNFIEVLYDPYLTWRNFLKGNYINYAKLNYRVTQLNVEIVPFIYDYFQLEKHHLHHEIGISLLNVFGAVISGAQQNGLRAISPATVSILIKLLSTWECNENLRRTTLHAFTMTAIVLQKSSPEQRQIDLLTIFQLYLQAIKDLLTTQHFCRPPSKESFEIADPDDEVAYIDVNALNAIIANVEQFVAKADLSRAMISNALFEAKYVATMVVVPEAVKSWDIDKQLLGTTTIRTINTLCHASEKISNSLIHSNNINLLFDGLRELGPKPSYNLVNECVKFAFDLDNNGATIVGIVVIKLIEWIGQMGDNEQNYLSEMLLKKCAISVQSKRLVCEHRSISKICATLEKTEQLSSKCAINLIKLIEELGKYNLHCIELKHIFGLLRTELGFEYRRQLIDCIYKVSHFKSAVAGCVATPIEFFDVQTDTNGITVPEIRQWDNYQNGFVLHCWVKLEPLRDFSQASHSGSDTEDENRNYRRQIFSLTTSQGSGYEFFVQKNGNFVIGVNTKQNFLTASVTTGHLLDGRWHSITVSIVPPKRLFSYHQINVHIDGVQKLGSTMKFADFKEPFHYCAIGAPYTNARKLSTPKLRNQQVARGGSQESSSPKHDEKSRGLFPNIIEKSFFPGLVSQVPHYFTLPIKANNSSLDPSVKSFPNGMQDLIFGEPMCLRGQIGNILLADTSINVKQLFEAGTNFANLLATDLIESFDLGSKYIFCFSPAACFEGLCVDLAPGNRYNGYILANCCQSLAIQDAINGIGGVMALFPILEHIAVTNENFISNSELISLSPSADRTPIKEEAFGDWELMQPTSLSEVKINQNPISCFLCLVRDFVVGYDWNQQCLLNSDGVATLAAILKECNTNIIDVHVLMGVQLLVEAIQNEAPASNLNLLHVLYKELVFDFRIWARAQFQIIIGHVQYISTIIKDDRKYFRKNFGIQFFLDVIQEHFTHNEKMSSNDLKTVRESLIRIIKYYIQKEVNIKEVSTIISYLASIKNDKIVTEILNLLSGLMEAKACKDQLFLLMYEPHMAELLYALFVDKSYGNDVHVALLKLINVILTTKRISNRHKMALRLFDTTIESGTMFPGLLSYMLPFNLETYVVLNFLDQTLASDSEAGYSGCLNLIYHSHMASLSLKLEIAQRLLTTTFTKVKSPQMLARQIGWQESIARLLIKKPITNSMSEKDDLGLPDMEEIVKNEAEPTLEQSDLMVFDEENMEMQVGDLLKNYNNNNMLSEAANVIEHEIKELADSVSGAVADNFSSVYSVIKQKTCDFQDTLEHLTMGSFEESLLKKQTSSISSSDENISLADSLHTTSSLFDNVSINSRSTTVASQDTSHVNPYTDISIDDEENLVYLISNTLFTILWRGVENTDDSWKERGQVMACINLIALNNELYCSHLTLRLRILELGVQAALIDLAENVHQPVVNQQNSAQLLRMAYDLIVLDPNEDDAKKCSTKLLDGVLSLLDMLMVFQSSSTDDWSEMTHLCLGLLLKCASHPKSEIVAMATAKLHALLQNRNAQDLKEISYLIYSLNQALQNAIEVGNSDQYSFLIPVMKALLEKTRLSVNLTTNAPDMPSTSSGPEFFHEFQMYCTSKQWNSFMEKKIKPLYAAYQKDVSKTLREPLDTFWAECYEACKKASQHRAKLQMESRRRFQEKILVPWRVRQSEENARLSILLSTQKARDKQVERRWLINKRFLYGPQGAWAKRTPNDEFWKLSHHENMARMRFKLEPSLYHDPHTAAANLRDNTTTTATDQKMSAELGSSIATAALGDENQDEDSILIEEEIRNSIESQIPEPSGKEKIVISQECELITLMTRIKGRLDLTTNQFMFTDLNFNHRDTDENRYDFKFPIAQIREVHLRKYNLRRSALEIFLIDQTSYFLNFGTKTRNKVFTKILGLQPPNILYGSGRSPAELLRASGLTQRWVNREISNFEYLMHLNTIAGRSYNDLSQYPVFPWILADYTSEILDLTDPKSYRDLSKPIGAVNPKNESEVRTKYEGFEDPSGMIPKFHYGTHYSNSAGVLHYLLRVEPFTSLHIELQSGRFDVADRQFHSIPQTYKLLMDNPNDVKELIPEFFYFPEFLKNMNHFDLGVLQISKERVNDVALPTWAKTPEDFIAIHRRALESEYVSQNLHNWIDLIFGCKQKGPKAVEALNVFYYCSYEGAVDLDKIQNPIEREAVEGMINNFGQTPSQLLKEAHPRRLSQEELTIKLMKLELKKPDMSHFLDRIASINCELSLDKDPVVYLSPPRSPPRSFLQTSPDQLVTITKSGILGCNSWMSFDKEKGFLLEIDATTTNVKNRKKLTGPFHPAITLNPNLFAVSVDGKYLYAGGIWDNSLRVFNVTRGKAVASVIRHSDVITCVALDNCGSYLVTGSKDSTCIVWSINSSNVPVTTQNTVSHHHHSHLTHSVSVTSSSSQSQATANSSNSNLVPKHVHTLYGHDNAVSCVAIMTELDMVVSGSLDGKVNVHTIEEGHYIRTLEPLGCSGLRIEISFITISYQGQIAFSALDDKSHSIHIFSVNGVNLGSKYVSGRVTGLATASDSIIVADDAGDLTMSRLYGLKPIFDIPLHIPTQTLVTTSGNTHVLSPLRDGSLAVIGVQQPIVNKKHIIVSI